MRSLPGPTHLTGKGFPMRTHAKARRATLISLAAGLAAAMGAAGSSPPSHAATSPADAALTVEAPIHSVVVYSDRARVTRSARVKLSGTQPILLPLLQGSVDPSSIRLEAQGAEVLRIETTYVDASELPEDEAQRLLKGLEKIDDDLSRIQGEQEIYRAQLNLLQRLLPAVPPQGTDVQKPPARLNSSGWATVITFIRSGQEKLYGKVAEEDEQLRTLRRQRQELVDKARLLGGIAHRAGYRVAATLAGQGAAQVALTYMTAGARWLPTYDIQLLPAQNRVELSLAGLVSQETGEDWNDVALTLSTAVPATATQLPKLLSWKIGMRERFIPTPQPLTEVVPPPPPAPTLREAPSAAANLRSQLLARTGLSDERTRRISLPDDQANFVPTVPRDVKETADKTKEPEIPRREWSARLQALQKGNAQVTVTAAPAQPAAPPPEEVGRYKSDSAGRVVDEEVDRDADGIPDSVDAPETAAPAAKQGKKFEAVFQVVHSPGEYAPSKPRPPLYAVGITPPAGYQAPRYARNLPAALAGGYDLSYPSLYKDSIGSGQGARRVALLARSFPVSVLRKLTPALAPEAFLVAEIKNPATEPLPGGQANLFVGADPAGVATLPLVAAGETFTLPLGLDRAVKPIRNVRLTTEEKGVFSKDEITEYVVTTELVNPYPLPIELKLLDQIPLPGDKHVEIKLVRTQPQAQHDPIKGSLEWRQSLPAGGKLVTQFVYTLRRPKGYRLSQ